MENERSPESLTPVRSKAIWPSTEQGVGVPLDGPPIPTDPGSVIDMAAVRR